MYLFMEKPQPRFIADVHLGKLAKYLRILGFDSLYQNDYTKTDLLHFAIGENRILLSRDGTFADRPVNFFRIQHEDPLLQLMQVAKEFHLEKLMHPFSRCLACNGRLVVKEKESLEQLLQENTRKYFSEFWQCTHCYRIYWKGSHYERMLKLVAMIENNNEDSI
jgi:uncharacterized protein with PIN domain